MNWLLKESQVTRKKIQFRIILVKVGRRIEKKLFENK